MVQLQRSLQWILAKTCQSPMLAVAPNDTLALEEVVWIDIHGNKMFKLQARTQVSIELKM